MSNIGKFEFDDGGRNLFRIYTSQGAYYFKDWHASHAHYDGES